MKKFWLGFVVGIATTIFGGALLLGATVMLVGFYAQKSMAGGLSAPELHRMGGQPDFPYTTLDGQPRQFADLRGKVVFVSVWATWCAPCKAEMPSIQKLYKAYENDQEVEFLIIADETADKIRSTAKSSNVDLPFYIVKEDALPATLSVVSYPTTYIIARDGTVAAMHNGAADWSAASVKEFLNNLKSEKPSAVQDAARVSARDAIKTPGSAVYAASDRSGSRRYPAASLRLIRRSIPEASQSSAPTP